MQLFVAWAGFVGAWLLVAGPMFQAAVELREENDYAEQIEKVSTALRARHPPVSPWWWLLPPVHYWLQRRRSRRLRHATMESLTPEQLDGLVTYINKATGWLFVAGGAALIAVKETWELTEIQEWAHWVFWVLVAAMAVLATLNTALRVERTRRVLAPASPPAGRDAG